MTRMRPQEQMDILKQQHAAVLQQWRTTLDSAVRLRLVQQMRQLEHEADQLEKATRIPTLSTSQGPASSALPPHRALTMTLHWHVVRPDHYELQSDHPQWTTVSLTAQGLAQLRDGESLYAALFFKSNEAVLRAMVTQALNEQARLRLQIVSDGQPELLHLPWWHLRDKVHFILPYYGISLMHRLPDVASGPPLVPDPLLRILYSTSAGVEARYDQQIIREIASDFPHLVQMKEMQDRPPSQLIRTITQAYRSSTPYHVWHHHGLVSMHQQRWQFHMNGKSIELADIHRLAKGVPLFVLWTESDQDPTSLVGQVARIRAQTVLHLHHNGSAKAHHDFLRIFYTTTTMKPVDEGVIRASEQSYLQPSQTHLWQFAALYTRTDPFTVLAQPNRKE